MIAMNEPNDLLRQGITRAQNNDKSGARECFEQLAQQNPHHETVWLWLSSVATDAVSSAAYLEKALEVDPANQQARQWLGRLRPAAAERHSSWRCPICLQSFTAKPERCVRCRSNLTLGPVESFFESVGSNVDHQLISNGIERQLASQNLSPAERHRGLALAYLNLGSLQKALCQLGALSALCPEDMEVAGAVEALTKHLESPPSKNPSGAEPDPDRGGDRRSADFQTAEIDPVQLHKDATSAHIRRPLVLVVDDSPTVRSLVSRTLEQRGYRTLLASDGMEALSRLRESVPDLVLLDVTMPHLDGFKICRVIKDNDLTAHVPVVFLSGKDGFLDKVRGRMAGAVDYLSKPVTADTLLKVMERHCDRWIVDKR